MADDADKALSPWHPIKDSIDLKTLGKLLEELGELTSAVSRCIIQGPEESEPVTGKLNRHWLEDEIADVLAGIKLTTDRLGLNSLIIASRMQKKMDRLREWHRMA